MPLPLTIGTGRALLRSTRRRSGVWTPQGTVLEATTAADQLQVQEPSVIYESGAQILSGSVFKLWYSSGYASRGMSYAESQDGINWTKYASNPILTTHTRAFVFKSGGTYYMYAIRIGGQLDQLTSSDGISWSVAASNVLTTGSGWESSSINNVCVWIEGSTWYMLYEGGNGSIYRIGLATSSDGTTWNKSASNPVISNGAGSVSGPWLAKIDSTYYVWCQVTTSGTLPTDVARYTSHDLINWTRDPIGLVYPRTSRDEGVGTGAGQVADQAYLELNGQTWLFYTGMIDGSIATGHINAALAPLTLAQLAATDEGIAPTYQPNLLLNPGFERPGAGGADVFASWTETASDGAIAKTTTAGEYRSGTGGLKLTAGAAANTQCIQSIPAGSYTPGALYQFSGWARGDGVRGGRIRIFGSVDLITFPTNTTTSTTFTQFSATFTAPASGNINIYCYCPAANGGIAYFDDLVVRRI